MMRRLVVITLFVICLVVACVYAVNMAGERNRESGDLSVVSDVEAAKHPGVDWRLLIPGAAVAALALLATVHFAVSTDKLFANNKMTQALSGDVTTAAAVEWIDMRGYNNFAAVINLAVLGGNGVEAFSIVADAESAGGGGNVTIKTHGSPTDADAAGDMLVLECTAEEIAQLGAANSVELRYVAVKLECHHSSDQVVVTHILANPTFAKDGLTADVVA